MSELRVFVREALAQGKTRDEVRQALLTAGWRPDDVEKELGRYAEIPFPVPVPRPQPYLPARDTFLYLVLFLTLYITAIGLGAVCFQLINLKIPDKVAEPYEMTGFRDTLRWSAASVIIAFPVYLSISRLLHRAYQTDPERRNSRVRAWLTYLTLFVAATVLITDLITLLSSVLGGEETSRFILKTITVAVIAGVVFGYYLWEQRHDQKSAD